MTTPRKRPTPRLKAKRPRRKKSSVPQLLVRTSERSAFLNCRWAWDRGFNDRIKPRIESPALRFGSLIHKALELRYPKGIKRGPKPADAFVKAYDEELKYAEETWGFRVDDDEGSAWADAKEVGVAMMENFVDHYGRDEEWQVLASEMTFKVPVLDPTYGEPGGGRRKVLFYYVGTMDGVWKNRMDGGVRIIDWKTTRNDPVREGQGKGVLDEQATAYWTWGCDYLISQKILKPRDQEALDGMLYTFLRKAKKDERPQNADGHFLNKDGSVSKSQPPPLFHRELVYRAEADRESARARAIAEVREMIAARSGDLAVYKHPDTGAMGHCNWCGYRDICELHEVGADWESLRDATMTTWDPYAAHEIAEEGKR